MALTAQTSISSTLLDLEYLDQWENLTNKPPPLDDCWNKENVEIPEPDSGDKDFTQSQSYAKSIKESRVNDAGGKATFKLNVLSMEELERYLQPYAKITCERIVSSTESCSNVALATTKLINKISCSSDLPIPSELEPETTRYKPSKKKEVPGFYDNYIKMWSHRVHDVSSKEFQITFSRNKHRKTRNPWLAVTPSHDEAAQDFGPVESVPKKTLKIHPDLFKKDRKLAKTNELVEDWMQRRTI